jgi:predicted CDP-diglyceride synthetase/phosphatidate cytidylyltransferase
MGAVRNLYSVYGLMAVNDKPLEIRIYAWKYITVIMTNIVYMPKMVMLRNFGVISYNLLLSEIFYSSWQAL